MASTLGVWYGSWGYIAALSFLAVVASLAVALRFWSRRISGLGTHADDWLALVTLFVHHGLNATIYIAFLADGLGFNTLTLLHSDPRAAEELQKLTFIGTILYGTGSTSIRLAVIIFYFRIFPTQAVRRGGYVLGSICVAWFVAVEALNLATCTPVAYTWDRTIKGGHCISAPSAVIIIGAINVVIDAVTVGLPIHEVFKLHLSRQKKIIIFSIFLIGGIATAASLTRLVAISLYLRIDGTDGTGATSALLSATTGFEIYIAIIGACAPTLVPVYKKLRGAPTPSDTPVPRRSGYTTKPSKKPSTTYVKAESDSAASRTHLRESDDEERPFKRLDDVQVLVPPKERETCWTAISSKARPQSAQDIPLGGIRVQRDVTWG
ncbi:hypothetical protein F5Y19DRAFT_332140 [Xylariaceae sp. FL1651]|nr:hypothetical protein F5Y19DRAFT_332140 [Xylariaceae sp. FL1651]